MPNPFENFNSIKVQLKPARADCRDCVIRHFNSIKVQLKRRKLEMLARLKAFQFHKGTIKTPFSMSKPVRSSYFNSIKVQLKLSSSLRGIFTMCNFNSIKVQLKRRASILFCISRIYFNSIKVQLKLKDMDEYDRVFRFQFHKGTIKTLYTISCQTCCRISIP